MQLIKYSAVVQLIEEMQNVISSENGKRMKNSWDFLRFPGIFRVYKATEEPLLKRMNKEWRFLRIS